MERVFSTIELQSSKTNIGIPELLLADFRGGGSLIGYEPDKFFINPLQLQTNADSSKIWSLEGKRILLAPACPNTRNLICNAEIQQADWIGFLDRNPIQQGKKIDGHTIYSYEDISSLGVDAILVASPEKHRTDILDTIARNAPEGILVAELWQ
jgi:hypothetical protein